MDELYGLPLDRFVPERTALAKALKLGGQKDEAVAVAGLRKPSVAAWAVNQLVRTQGAALAELFEAGDALSRAQSNVLAGRGDSADLRAAVERERNVVAGLLDIARGLLTSEGFQLSPAVLERVAETLHAAALGDDARRAVSQGRLERELRHVGLGGSMASAASVAPPQRKRKPDVAPSKRKAVQPDARAAAKERAEARRAARIAEGDARRQFDVATRALKAAQARRDLAAQALAEAEAELNAAQAEARAAEKAYAVAKATLESF